MLLNERPHIVDMAVKVRRTMNYFPLCLTVVVM